MLTLGLRTDKPEAELYLRDGKELIDKEIWQAHRQLAASLHKKIDSLLSRNDKNMNDLDAVICFRGPGSFTGLRIGASVANALSGSLNIPVIGVNGEGWLEEGVKLLAEGLGVSEFVLPEYGSTPHITKPRK